MTAPTASQPNPPAGHGQLGVWDTVCIIIGIVIGSSIFTTVTTIFGALPDPWTGLGMWLVGGLLSLVGAFCYAELATTYPRSGGDYVYLTRAFGSFAGFMFGWAQLAALLTGSTAAMAFTFGEYFGRSQGVSDANYVVMAAVAAVGALALINFLGVILGKVIQDGLVLVKLAGFALIVYAGVFHGVNEPFTPTVPFDAKNLNYGLALILILYAYGGWNDAAFVAADLKNPRSITKALIWGIVGITAIYLLVNLAYIMGLGWTRMQSFNPTVAKDVLDNLPQVKDTAGMIVNILIMISALGAMNGLIFTGSRVYITLGSEHSVFAKLGKVNSVLKTPLWALFFHALVTIGMILLVGTAQGRDIMDNALVSIGASKVPWEQYFGPFNTIFAGTAPAFWIFFLLTGLSVFVLRWKDPNLERPFRLTFPWYPLLPLVFCATCVFGFYSAITYAKWVSLIGFIPLALGIPLYFLSGRRQTGA